MALDTKTIYRNDTPTFTFTITQGGQAFNLTGAIVKFAARESFESASYLFEKDCDITNPTGGVCQATLNATDTSMAGTYIAELEITLGSSVITVIQFYLVILKDIRHT